MAITGLSSQNSAIAATSAIARLVPTCTMASTLPRFTRFTASRSSAFGDARDRGGARALEAEQVHYLVAAFGEEPHHLAITYRHVGRDDAEPLHVAAVRAQGAAARIRAHRDAALGDLLELALQLLRAVDTVPERLRRHA